MRAFRLLVWCRAPISTGGVRLLSQLVSALTKQPQIAHIRIVIGTMFYGISEIEVLADNQVEVILPQPVPRRWLGIPGTGHLDAFFRTGSWVVNENIRAARRFQQFARESDVVYAFWPHLTPFIETDRPVVCTFQDVT